MLVRAKFVLLLLPILSAALAYAQAAPENTDVSAGDQTTAPTAVSAEALETPATTALGLKMQYDDAHLLTISARQIKLGDLLAAITEKTGVTFDLPDSLADRSVTAETGPLILRDALTALLKKLEVGYGISGDPAQPDTVERVVLTAESEAGSRPGGDNAKGAVTSAPEEQSEEGMTPREIEDLLAQKAVLQNRDIEKNLAEAEAERQAQIAAEDFGGKPPEPGKVVAPAKKRKQKSSAPPNQN